MIISEDTNLYPNFGRSCMQSFMGFCSCICSGLAAGRLCKVLDLLNIYLHRGRNFGISPTAGGGAHHWLLSSPPSPSPSPQVQRGEAELDLGTWTWTRGTWVEVARGGKQVHRGVAEVYLLSSECNFNAMLTRREASTPRRSRGVLASLRVNIAEESVVKAPSATSAQCWRGGRQVHRGEAEVYLPPSESTLQRSRPSPPPPAVGLMISTPISIQSPMLHKWTWELVIGNIARIFDETWETWEQCRKWK